MILFLQQFDLKDVDIKYLCNFFLEKMSILNYFVLNLNKNNIKDDIGVEVGNSISNMIELGYLDLNLGNNLIG